MTRPLISVVTICRNSASTIEETIKSIVAQDYSNKEYVVIDGGSTDGTLDILHRYASAIDVLVSEPDEGISDAFNKGIRAAHGDLIVFINADDILLPDTLAHVADNYSPDIDVLACNVIMEDSTTGYRCREIPSTDFPTMPFFRHVAHQGAFVSHACYDRFGGYDTAVRWPMDLDFLMRVSRGGGRFKHLDVDAAVFRSGGTTNSTSIFRKRRDYLRIVRNNGGNWLQAWTFFLFLVATQIIKRIISCFGHNLSQRLRYKATQQ